jgi:hypothetical protein
MFISLPSRAGRSNSWEHPSDWWLSRFLSPVYDTSSLWRQEHYINCGIIYNQSTKTVCNTTSLCQDRFLIGSLHLSLVFSVFSPQVALAVGI